MSLDMPQSDQDLPDFIIQAVKRVQQEQRAEMTEGPKLEMEVSAREAALLTAVANGDVIVLEMPMFILMVQDLAISWMERGDVPEWLKLFGGGNGEA